MSRRVLIDPWIPMITLVLVGTGLIMIYSASAPRALSTYDNSWHFTARQGTWVGLGLIALLFGAAVDYRHWRHLAPPLYLLTVALLAFTLIPGIGIIGGGARRWLGVAGFTLQPSELAKVTCVMYLAGYLARHGEELQEGYIAPVLRPLLLIGLVLALIVAEPDLGNAVAIAAVAGCLLFVGGIAWRYIFPLLVSGVAALGLAVYLEPYRVSRITSYLDPWADPHGSGFQVIQSFLAFGSGGVTGMGLGEGQQKLFFLPEPHTDFIFSVVGEEMGLLGALALLGLFALLAWRGLLAAWSRPDVFGRYLGLGLTLMIVIQALVNMGVTVGVLPNKGLPLPLVSYGGSSLLINLFAIGILINLSRDRRRGGAW